MSEKLVPKKEGQAVNGSIWHWHTSDEHKFELWDGIPFSTDPFQRDKLTLCLIYSMGLEHLLALLPNESKEELQILMNSSQDYSLPYDYDQTFKDYRNAWNSAGEK